MHDPTYPERLRPGYPLTFVQARTMLALGIPMECAGTSIPTVIYSMEEVGPITFKFIIRRINNEGILCQLTYTTMDIHLVMRGWRKYEKA